MAFTKVTKPTSTSYTNVNSRGREQYSDANITYSDPNVFYNGVDDSAWTDILKPMGNLTINAGMISALVMPVTYSVNINSRDRWTRVNKPTI